MSSDDSDSSGGEASRKYLTLQEVVDSAAILEPLDGAAGRTAADDPLSLSLSIVAAESAPNEPSLRQSVDGSRVSAADGGVQPALNPRGAAFRVEEHLRRSAVLRQRAAEVVALHSSLRDGQPVMVDISAEGIRSLKRAYATRQTGRNRCGNSDDFTEGDYPDVAPTPWYYNSHQSSAPSSSRLPHLESRCLLTRSEEKKSPRGTHAARHEHYREELQRFYETVFEVELDDEVLPSGGSRPPSSHLPPETYRIRREQLVEHVHHSVPLLLSKFHGFEEDLFRLLKAKYDAPTYRFRHYEELSR